MRKRYYKITQARLRKLEQKWRPVLTRFLGPVPGSLAIAHMLGESNGQSSLVVRNIQTRPLGLMQIPYAEGRRFRYTAKDLQENSTNLYVWCMLANEHAEWLHDNYSEWTTPDVDFWVAIRAIFILGRTNFENIYDKVTDTGLSKMTGMTYWVRNTQTANQRFNGLSRVDLRRIVDHLEEVRTSIEALDGPGWVSPRFSEGPTVAPGDELMRQKTTAASDLEVPA